MLSDHPDFNDWDRALELYQLALRVDASPSQIAMLTTLFDILGDPSYNPDTSEHLVELGTTRRWFGQVEWSTFLLRASALMGDSAALSLSLAAHSPFDPANSSSAVPASMSDDVTPRGFQAS